MAAEYTNIPVQTVDADQNILFNATPVPCTRGYVMHREGSGVFTLKGITNCAYALYRVQFDANIGIPDGGTVAPIAIAISQAGEPLQETLAIVEPAATEDLWSVSRFAIIRVPRGCCVNIAVENATTPDQAIIVQNANLEINKIA